MMDGSDTVLLSIGQLDPVSASSLGQILRIKKHNIVIDVVAASYSIILKIYATENYLSFPLLDKNVDSKICS